jgi:DNA invertase Pin-like site-specific DNA recombinase
MRDGNVVIVNRLARLGRNMVHTIQLEEFNHHGVHFRAFDLRTLAGRLLLGCSLLLINAGGKTTKKRVSLGLGL